MLKEKTKVNLLMAVSLLLLLALLIILMFSGGNLDLVKGLFGHGLDGDQIRDRLMEFGPRGYVSVALLSALQVVCTVLPAQPIQVLSGVAFGVPVALACCAVGTVLGNLLIFLLYKTYGDSLRRYFTKKLRFDLEKLANSDRIAVVVFLLYFIPAIPYGVICFFAASIGMKFRRYIIATSLGALPSILIGVALGNMAMMSHWSVSVCVFLGIIILFVVLVVKRDDVFDAINRYADAAKGAPFKVKPCRRGLVAVLYAAVRVYFFFCGVRVKPVSKLDGQPENPCIVLCNHGSFFDFLYAGGLLWKNAPHFIIARLYFYHKWLRRLLTLVGGFPKSMFAMDMESVKNSLRVLNGGGMLAMMPEARLSTVGRFEDIQENTYSFLKKSGVNVYTVKINGDYLAKPKWGSGLRRGALVEAELDILYTAEEIAKLSVDEIRAGVEQRLDYDEFEWLKTKPKLRYRSSRLAEGLENILTLCPRCGKKHTLTTRGHDIFCEHCGKLTTLDERYSFPADFTFENFAQWYDWQKDALRREIEGDPDYALTSPVELRLPSEDGKSLTRSAGRGVCTLDRSGLRYAGTRDGEPYEAHFSLKRLYRLLFGAGENFEIYNGSEILYFVPDERRSAVDWYMASMILNDAERTAGKAPI